MNVSLLSLALLAAGAAQVETQPTRTTELYVRTIPPGAVVIVDGQRVGTSDGLFSVGPGVRRIIVELEGHDPQGKEVTIRAGEITRLKLKLRRRPASGRPPSKATGTAQPLAPGSEAVPLKLFSASHGADAGVLGVAFSPDGKMLAAIDATGKVVLRDARTAKQIMGFDLLTAEERKVIFHSAPRHKIHSGGVAFSPDGKTLAVGGGPMVKLYDATTGRLQLVLEDKGLTERFPGRHRFGAPPARGDPVAVDTLLLRVAHGDVFCVAFSPDGTLLATSGEQIIEATGATPGALKLWDAKTGELKRDLGEHFAAVPSVAFSPDGKILASAGNHPPGWTTSVRFWDPQSGTVKSVLQSPRGSPWSVAYSPDGRMVAAGGIVEEDDHTPSGMLLVWNARTGAMLLNRPLPRLVASLAFSADGKTLAAAEHEKGVTLFNPQTGEPKHEIRPAEGSGDLAGQLCVAFSPAGNVLAIGGRHAKQGGFVEIWRLHSDQDTAVGMPGAAVDRKHMPAEVQEAFEQIRQTYFEDVDRNELIVGAIRGMINSLDQHSNYISHDELTHLHRQLEQRLGGIGIALKYDQKTGRLLVTTPLPKMPAYRAGVRAGDAIVEIDGKPAGSFPKGKELATAARLLRGKPGDAVTIGVKHAGSEEVQQIEIVRATIDMPAVEGDLRKADGSWNFMLDEKQKIGYVRLGHFGPRSAEELQAALNDLQSKAMKGFILDLRFNPGGSLSQAIRIADLFIESGTIVTSKGRNAPDRVWSAKEEGTLSGFPMAVLVNNGSAGASEIVAACLQDHKRAIVAGERSYGRGIAQSIIQLEGDDGALKLTTATFLRPSGNNLHRLADAKESDPWGVVPDAGYEVKLSPEELKQYIQYRQQRDVFGREGPPESDFQDRPLQKAIDYLLEELGETTKPEAN